MSNDDQTRIEMDANFAAPSGRTMQSVNLPLDSFKEVVRRINLRKGDRSTHRAYHSLYEDMLN